ncbi:L-lactate dehydrogenase [Sphingomonas prati]|uniref:L-lactate dehydrogenase n=1 Tax=Sphingomonas prati TaxID=1843237 RepID=A0A7W9BS99_9SPHN|nr:L-lactate dehydrogenase [Sphingomonas prati]MBB5728663.1 L-lactate dehydrogenase [Sphingomonas prati]GGE72068.1 L-lactate dehydrogenase [Sphingomonas prati]
MSVSSRVAIVGAGNVGATAAYALMLRGLFSEIVIIDKDADRAVAEATDIADANAIARPARIWAGDYADARSADILVLTAGAATHGDETRTSIATKSAAIVRACIADAMGAGFDGVLVVSSNPVDAMTQVAQAASDLPPERVIGTGTLLDSNRFRKRIAQQLGVAPGAVDAMVLGEHGDSEVVAYSTVRIGGLTLDAYLGKQTFDRAAIAHDVMRAGYAINHGKGYTSFGVASAIVRICEAVQRDERVVLPVGTRVTGQYGIDDVYLSLPCLIGATGVLRVLTPDLSADERTALLASADTLRETLAGID